MAVSVPKFLKAILKLPPSFASSRSTLQVKPLGGSHRASASASRKAR